ncbi:MAG: ABC transporter substrate-binding protein [Clostridia bacterium]|nr:ABC transporter substrate-binding protein [Clostridia bacterium]MDO4356206.1 ABC transporter substrate-binding protein [Clostridia bacterium]
MKIRKSFAMLLTFVLLFSAVSSAPGAWMSAALAEEESADEQVLVFKTPNFAPGYAEYYLVKSFNQTHPGKKIVIEEIPDEQLLATEIMSGEADYMINAGYLDPFKYSNSGQFYDIYEWMEADPDFHREDYYENLFTAMECDGHLYAMPAIFCFAPMVVYLNGVIAEALDASYQLLDPITPSEILDLYESAKAKGLMSENTPLVFEDVVAPGVALIASTEFASYVDLNTRTTNFSTPEFISLLERTKQAYTEKHINGWGTTLDSFSKAVTRQKTDSLVKFDSIGLARDPYWESGLNAMPEGLMGPLVLQTNNGDVRARENTAYMVPKSCSNPELAWEFIKFCISPIDEKNGESVSTVDKTGFGIGFPLSKKNLALYAQKYRTFGSADFDASLAKLEERIGEICIFDLYIQGVEALSYQILSQYYDYNLITAEECAKQMDERAYLYLNE